MNFFVAAQRIRDGRARASEGRRIENDRIVARDDSFVFGARGVRLQPVEHVDGFEGAFVRESIRRSVACRSGDGFGALIERVNMSCAGARGVQREAPEKTETEIGRAS